MKKHYIFMLLVTLFSTPLYAQEFAYVTDSLQLRLFASPSDDSKVLLSIESGESVEVLESQNGYSRIVTNDGTQGWVKSAFLVEDPPEKLLYYAVSQQNEELKKEIEDLKNNTLQTAELVNERNTDQIDTSVIEELKTQLEHEKKVNQNLTKLLNDTKKTSNPNGLLTTVPASFNNPILLEKKWLVLSIVAALLLMGFLLGIKISAWRMRKRLHGFKLK